ncbi:uncharacterized protein LOC131950152 [Physella acuta]|uniref:uncharacterized protein LOC131950152 n=1 Tax=Physella acuta TaxID=109671 RepID=UPI0027DE74C2|nr:uncharacterized protein LOC131950152 [Physella acuta]
MTIRKGNVSLVFKSGRAIVGCKYTIVHDFNDRTTDVYFNLIDLINVVEITLESPRKVCEVFVSGGRNVALKQQTAQINTHRWHRSEKAVDGDRSNQIIQNSCTHTEEDIEPNTKQYWTITFSRDVFIQRFKIFNRVDIPERLAGFFLEAFNSTKDIPVYSFHDTSTKTDTLVYDWAIQMFVANRVTIYLLDNILTLCEVEIYGDSKSSCMPSTGVCRTGGCTPGYKGKDCEEEKRCSAAPNITKGAWHNCQNELRSVCTLVCEDGYEVKGNDNITCQANQEWTMPGVCSTLENGCIEGWFGPGCYYRDIMLLANEIYPQYLRENGSCYSTNFVHIKFKAETYFISVRITFFHKDSNISAATLHAFLNGNENKCPESTHFRVDSYNVEILCKSKLVVTEIKIIFNSNASICKLRVNGGRDLTKEANFAISFDSHSHSINYVHENIEENCLIIKRPGKKISLESKFDWPREVYQIQASRNILKRYSDLFIGATDEQRNAAILLQSTLFMAAKPISTCFSESVT